MKKVRKFENRGRKVEKKWQLGGNEKPEHLYCVVAVQASYICFSFYQAWDIFSKKIL